MKDPPN